MIYIGIDPGLATVGFGVIKSHGQEVFHVAHGIFKTPATAEFAQRLHQIKTDLTELLRLYQPMAVGVEELFFAANTKTALKVAHARGVLLETVFSHKMPMVEMTPLQLKSAICGDGSADKIQMQTMVQRLLKLSAAPRPDDAADALGIAIYAARVFRPQI